MSSIIESAARTAKNSLPGIGVGQEAAQRQQQRGTELIKKLALGGLALGGGTSALVALANYLKSLSQESELEDPSRLNDDTLYIPVEHQKEASSSDTAYRWAAPGLAVTGGVLSAGAAYALTQAIYNYMQKKHRQQLLDEAQNETMNAVADEAQKKASASLTFSDLVTAFPVAVPLLAALASGGIAYAALNKTFPTVGKPKSKFPKRIRAVTEGGEVEPIEADKDTMSKYASENDCEAAAFEFLSLFTDSVAMQKRAHSLTSDIINKVAKGGKSELEKLAADYDMESIISITKGASDSPADPDEKATAAALVFKSARLSPLVSVIAASEMLEMLPNVERMCAGMDEDRLDKAAGLGVLLHLNLTRPGIMRHHEKSAAASPALAELIQSLSSKSSNGDQSEQAEDRDAAMTSDVSGSMGEDFEGGDQRDPSEDDESQAKGDVIDAFMEAPHKAPPPRH